MASFNRYVSLPEGNGFTAIVNIVNPTMYIVDIVDIVILVVS